MQRTVPGRVCLVVLLLASGCAGFTPVEETPRSDVSVEVSNDHDRAYVVSVGVAPADHRGLAVEFVNGTARTFPDASGIEDLPEAVIPRAVSLRPVGDTVETRVYRWDSPQGTTATFDDVPRNATVFYSVAYPSGTEPMRTLGRLSCGPRAELTTVTLRVTADGTVQASNDCFVDADAS